MLFYTPQQYVCVQMKSKTEDRFQLIRNARNSSTKEGRRANAKSRSYTATRSNETNYIIITK